MEKWFVAAKKADFDSWSEKFRISPVTARIIRNREITEEEEIRQYLYGKPEDMSSPWLLKDMEKAVAILRQKIGEGKEIRVIGDYDVDGICSAHILTEGLRAFGAHADTAIPHRIKDGYGLNGQLIGDAYENGIDTIITCDNGIAAADVIADAKRLGMTMIVTDHHEVPFEETPAGRQELLPPADAVVDPKQSGCTYPFKGICGGVVAYKLVQALAETMEDPAGRPASGLENTDSRTLLSGLLQFAALATVCDVMELQGENRILVKEGLNRMRSAACPGIKALLEVNGLEPGKLSAYHLGFVIGPCLNASGRLDTAMHALELLGCSERGHAVTIAGELKELNDSRKTMTLHGIEEAKCYVEEHGMTADKILVIYLPHCHESLAGIIAGRIKEQYGKPVFVLTRGEEGVKGSGRSIESYHMYEAMTQCKELFTKYGGHKMAAGLSMQEENIPLFRKMLNEKCSLTPEDFMPIVHIDVPLPLKLADRSLAKELEILEPFGMANPKPLFARKDILFLSGRLLGAKGNFAKFTVMEEDQCFEAVFFGDLVKFHDFLDSRFGAGSSERLYIQKCNFPISITYQIGINSFRGKEEIQLIMQNYC